jgi:hypothetical protein
MTKNGDTVDLSVQRAFLAYLLSCGYTSGNLLV